MVSVRPMCDVIRVLLVLDVVLGLICPSLASAPEYEFDLHLYQNNITWLQCPKGWTNFGISCVLVITEKASFEESEINCQSYGGHLVYIDRLNKNKFIGQRSRDEGIQDSSWIGFWRNVTGTYQWTNGRTNNQSLGFWLPGQPQILHNDLKLCAYMDIRSSASQDRWKLDRCETKKAFVCEIEACVTGDFRCESGECVSPQLKCDGDQDCRDGSDELTCGPDSCGGLVDSPQIQYPATGGGLYQPWLNCQWKIKANIGYKVQLQFSKLDTELLYDEIRVYDGLTSKDRLMGTYSGSQIPPTITSTTNFLLVTFTTDHSVERTGFIAEWASVLSLCDSSLETLEADNKMRWLTSPGYPESYSDNLQCSWIIRAAREEHVTINVLHVDLLESDWLEIRDGASRESTLVRRYSGLMESEVLVSSGRHFYLHLHTDLVDSGTGFNISYHSGCDITVFHGYGRISSPGFHAGQPYPDNLQCSWTLQDVDNQESTLILDFFHTEYSYDFLQIYNSTIISPQTLLMNLSGRHGVLTPPRSSSGYFVIHFQTDNLVSKAGWSASFSFDCHDNSTLPENLSVTSSTAHYKSYITYSCDKGYQLEGTSKRVCDMGGVWNSTIPVCKLINCGPPLTLENGILLNLTSRNYDGVAYYRCDPGHGATDTVYKVTCLEDGWVEMPTCNPTRCPKLKSVPNGIIYAPYLYHIYTRAEFRCKSGYRIDGHMTSECKHGGQWSHPEPICVPINYTLCDEVKVIHGSVNQTGPVSVGETIHITCNHGYQLDPNSPESVTCTETGKFDTDVPTCSDIDECETEKPCGPLHKCHNTMGSFWCECRQGYQHISIDNPFCEDIDECLTNNGSCNQNCENTEGSYKCSCNDNYRLYRENHTQVINRRLLVPNHSCYVLCEDLNIERSEQLIYTTKPLKDGSYLYPTSLYIVCPHGSMPDGPTQLTCQENGTWSANVTKCIVGQCEDLDEFEGGDIVYTSNMEAGSFANYSCKPGYSIHGNRSRFCLTEVNSQGHVTYSWTGAQPTCEVVDCQAPPSLKHGNVSYGSTKLNNIAIYSCNHGYRLEGLPYRTCLFSGLWNTEVILCVAQTCPLLQAPTAGSLTSNNTWYGMGTVVSFTCNDGYQLSDNSPLLCDIPERFDVGSVSLPQLEFLVSVTVFSSEALEKLKQNCSLYYSQWLEYRLVTLIKQLQIAYAACKWPADADKEVFHQSVTVKAINETINEVTIVKKVHIYPAHTLLPAPVREEDPCFEALDTRHSRYNLVIQSNSICEKTYTSKLEIYEPKLVCEDGVPVKQGDVTFCVKVNKGPVYMIVVNILLRVNATLRSDCSAKLKEHIRVTIQDTVGNMKLAELCPQTPNVVLTNTSGSLRIDNKLVDVNVPFFLHDLTSPFSAVQECGAMVQSAFDKLFKDSIHHLIQQINTDCSSILFTFSDNDFTILPATELCQAEYEFDPGANTCVYCGICGIINTTSTAVPTSTSIAFTTPTVISSTASSPSTQTQSSTTIDITESTLSITTSETTESFPFTSTSVSTTSTESISSKPTSPESTTISTTVRLSSTTKLQSETPFTTMVMSSTKRQPTTSTKPTVTNKISSTETTSSEISSSFSTTVTTDGFKESSTTTTSEVSSTVETITPVQSTEPTQLDTTSSQAASTSTGDFTDSSTTSTMDSSLTQSTVTTVPTTTVSSRQSRSVTSTATPTEVSSFQPTTVSVPSTEATLSVTSSSWSVPVDSTTTAEETSSTEPPTTSVSVSTESSLPDSSLSQSTTLSSIASSTPSPTSTHTTPGPTSTLRLTSPTEPPTASISSTEVTLPVTSLRQSTTQSSTAPTTPGATSRPTTSDVSSTLTSSTESPTTSVSFSAESTLPVTPVSQSTTLSSIATRTPEATNTTRLASSTKPSTTSVSVSTEVTLPVTPFSRSTTLSSKATTTPGTTSTSRLTTVTKPTTVSPLLDCTSRTGAEVVVPDLDLSVQQFLFWMKSDFQVENINSNCLGHFTDLLKELALAQEKEINMFPSVKERCIDNGMYVKLTQLRLTISGSQVTLQIAAAYTKIAGSQRDFSIATISSCVATIIPLPEMRSGKCLFYSGRVEAVDDLCDSLPLTDIRLSQTRFTRECSEGWSYNGLICVQDATTTTTTKSTLPSSALVTNVPTATSTSTTTVPTSESIATKISTISTTSSMTPSTTSSPTTTLAPSTTRTTTTTASTTTFTPTTTTTSASTTASVPTTISSLTSTTTSIPTNMSLPTTSSPTTTTTTEPTTKPFNLTKSSSPGSSTTEKVLTMTTTTVMVEETTRPGMHECYVCDTDTEQATSNKDCIDAFESCTMENPVCKTEVWYQGRSGHYIISKGCDTQKQCEISSSAAASLCHSSSSNAYCVYCCNSSKCNLDVEILTFKGRKKRSTHNEVETKTAQWNGTVPFCRDKSRPEFIDCPDDVVLVDDSKLPISVNVPVPSAFDNSGIQPTITVSPSNFTQPYWVYQSTNVTFTAADEEGLKTSCVIQILVEDVTPPWLNCPNKVLKIPVSTLENTTKLNYNDIEFHNMVHIEEVKDRDLIPDQSIIVNVLEEVKVTLTIWDFANNSVTCSFLIMYIPMGCPVWTLGSPLNVVIKQSSSAVVMVQCSDNAVMVHGDGSSNTGDMEYTCQQNAEWTPLGFIPDCIQNDESICPDWSYNISWNWSPDAFMSIQPLCNLTGRLSALILQVLDPFDMDLLVLSSWNATDKGKIRIFLSFKMTSKTKKSAPQCLTVKQVQTLLNNLNVSSECQGSALLTNATILDATMDCTSGLVLVKNNQEDGMCWPCPRGMEAKSSVCELCPVGTYRDSLNTTNCSQCPVNRSTRAAGSISLSHCLEMCQPGWFSTTGVTPCVKCPQGMYQSTAGSITCQPCDDGSSTLELGSTDMQECQVQCSVNEYSDSGFVPCSLCPHGYYNNQTQSTRCYRCIESSSAFSSCSDTCGEILCGDHGTCATKDKSLFCHCQPEFTGDSCNIPISYCDKVTCLNDGTCTENNGSFRCSCKSGYTGHLCESKEDPCLSCSCDSGRCLSLHNGSCLCQCYQGYTGKQCEVRIDHCLDHICQHGECINLVDGYICNCSDTNYEGNFCERLQEHCGEDTCMNGGTCRNIPDGFTCDCLSGYEGLVCEQKKDKCLERSCQNGGICVTDTIGEAFCACMSGYGGDDCQIDDQICQVNPCQNGATCIQYLDKTVCHCQQGYTGTLCDKELNNGCASVPCNSDNSLECVTTDEGHQCICRLGWTGEYCHDIENLCLCNPCQHGGLCENHGIYFNCTCPPGYAGYTCEHDIDACHSNPCMNGGVCSDGPDLDYNCECTSHFYGDTCHMETDACLSSPCVHGECMDLIDGFMCSCSTDWSGTICDEAINKCLSLPCENGGTCIQNGTEFTCACKTKYTGEVCESEIKPCEPNPCVNAGVCTSEDLTFNCECPLGFHGDHCELVVNACDLIVCENGGICEESGMEGRCECTHLFTGRFCEKEKSDDFDMTISEDITGVCETELVADELTAWTLCLSYRYATNYNHGLILKMIDDRNETMLAVHGDQINLSFWNDSDPVTILFEQLDQSWHQACITWSSIDGHWSVHLDQQEIRQMDNYGLGRKLPRFKVSTQQFASLFQGQITGVNVYNKILKISDLDSCNRGNRGDVISWVMFDKCSSEMKGFDVTYPSSCPVYGCLPGYKGTNCDVLIDKGPPAVEYCPDDIVKVITVNQLRTNVEWVEPVFVDNIGIVRKNQTYYSGEVFTYGEYQVIYMAFDAEDNHAVCLFHIIVTPRHCKLPSPPLNGERSCDSQGHPFKYCSISCLDPSLYQFTEEPADVYMCREGGIWDPPRGKQFTFPPCAGYTAPSQSYQGDIILKASACTESAKLDLIQQLQQQFYQTGLCEPPDCQPSYINVDCITVSSKKRSTEPVLYKLTFSIPSPSSPIMNSTAVVESLEQFVKVGLTGYIVDDFTMDIQLQCGIGQILSADKESCVNCGKGYYFNSASRQCELCPLGSYSDQEKQTACISCGDMRTTLAVGSSSEDKCFYVCDVGYYLLDNECEPCEIGYYQDTVGSTQCKPCLLGYTTQKNTSTDVTDCYFACDILGYIMSTDGSCIPCSRGTYKSDRFGLTCTPCPSGFTTLTEGAKTEEMCYIVICDPGYKRVSDNTCERCSIGTFQNTSGQDFCYRCPSGHTTQEPGADAMNNCIQGEMDECSLQTDDCPESSVCVDTEDSFLCECVVGYTKMQDGSCRDNCLDVCIHGDCEYDSDGNPVCKCHDKYQGLKCDTKQEGLSAGSIIGICVGVLMFVVILAFFIFICLRQTSNDKGPDRQLLRFPIHRTDLRSSFRAIALAMNPFESSSERTMSSVLRGNRRKSKMSNNGASEINSNISSAQSKTSYF